MLTSLFAEIYIESVEGKKQSRNSLENKPPMINEILLLAKVVSVAFAAEFRYCLASI